MADITSDPASTEPPAAIYVGDRQVITHPVSYFSKHNNKKRTVLGGHFGSMPVVVVIKVLNEKEAFHMKASAKFIRDVLTPCPWLVAPLMWEIDDDPEKGVRSTMVTPRCELGDLATVVHRHHCVGIKATQHVAYAIAMGLRHLHSLGIAHRDVKPANILISSENGGRVMARVADLDLAGPADKFVGAGTPNFMAPEIITKRGAGVEKPATVAPADVWSMGATLFRIITGWPLFQCTGGVRDLFKIIVKQDGVLQPSTCVPEPLYGILRRTLITDDTQRASAEALVDVIRRDAQPDILISMPAACLATTRGVMASIANQANVFLPEDPMG